MIINFGYENAILSLRGRGIHSLSNLLTLSPNAHKSFDGLSLWFEAVVSHLRSYLLILNLCRMARRIHTFFNQHMRPILLAAYAGQSR
jgi:hypothetical protein